jgi:hypothetical protein
MVFTLQEAGRVSATFEMILALLGRGGVRPTVHEHAAVRTIDEAHALAPHLVENLAKTIAFEIEPGPRVVLAAVAPRCAGRLQGPERAVGLQSARAAPAARAARRG